MAAEIFADPLTGRSRGQYIVLTQGLPELREQVLQLVCTRRTVCHRPN